MVTTLNSNSRKKRIALTLLACLGYILLMPLWRSLREAGKTRTYRVFNYHSVTDGRDHETSVDPMSFKNQMSFLAENAAVHSLLDLAEGADKIMAEGRQLVALTFDDGYADNLTKVLPVLQEYYLKATCFIVTSYVGTDKLLPHDWDNITDACRLMSWQEARCWLHSGMRVGSHGVNHVRSTVLSKEERLFEMTQSRKDIAETLHINPAVFAYPFGKFGDYPTDAVAEATASGYSAVASAVYGWNRVGRRSAILKRIGIEASDTMFTFKAKLNGAMDLLVLFESPAFRLPRSWCRDLFCKHKNNGEATSQVNKRRCA